MLTRAEPMSMRIPVADLSRNRRRYLYRAVDGTGQTIDFLLSAKRNKQAANRFFRRALSGLGICRFYSTASGREVRCRPGAARDVVETLVRSPYVFFRTFSGITSTYIRNNRDAGTAHSQAVVTIHPQ